jgi:ribonuclease E
MRQLRLRDLGGIIVVDYIDMKEKRHRLAVQQAMYQEAKKDRSQIVILPMSRFCIVEIARQKIRPSLQLFGHSPCPACKGSGLVRDVQSIGIELLRRLNSLSERQDVYVVELSLNPEVADFLSCKAQDIAALESKGNKRVHIHKDPNLGLEEVKLTGYNIDGIKVFEAD